MSIKSNLFDLPNELFLLIFQYLSSGDLIEAFFPFESSRVRKLLYSFVLYLDLSERTDQWVKNYVDRVFEYYPIIGVRLEDRQLDLISNQIESKNIQSLSISSSDWTTEPLKRSLAQIRRNLTNLKIIFTYAHGQCDIAEDIFQSDSSLEQVQITGRFLYFHDQDLNTSHRLKSLSIELDDMHRLFALAANLPNVEDLKVKFRGQERLFQSINRFKFVELRSNLRRVTFIGSTKSFDQFNLFFAVFGSTIETLSLQIDMMFNVVNGQDLEKHLLNNLPRLSSLNLILHSSAVYSEPIKISQFQSSIWENFSPIVYWHDIRAHQQTIFTIPYRSDRFKYVSNESISSWISNRTDISLRFDHVRWLTLCATTPFTLETLKLVQSLFPQIQCLEITLPIRSLGVELNNPEMRKFSYFADDFLDDVQLTFPTVRKLSLPTPSNDDDYQSFVRLLRLLPNLISLQMFIGRSMYLKIFFNEDQGKFVRTRLMNIEHLQMVRFYHEKNVLTDEEIRQLFPNAVILLHHDDL